MRKKVPPIEKGHCKSPILTELEREWRIRERSQQHNQPRLLNSSSAGFFLTTYTATTQATILFSHCNTLVSLNPAFSPSNPSVSQSTGKTCPTLWSPWTTWGACQAPLSTWSSKKEYWSGLPFPPPRHLSNPGMNLYLLPVSPALAGRLFTTWTTWETQPTGWSNLIIWLSYSELSKGLPLCS